MAPQMSHLALRAITYRIISTPTHQLPRITPLLTQLLWNCKDLLSSPDVGPQRATDTRVQLNGFYTHLSSLLQDRSVERRWSGIVLLKAAIEAGGYETLRRSSNWVRALLSILKKPDPPSIRNLCTITLTRIFLLTRDFPALLREITTPALPTFVATCLSNANKQRRTPSELQTVLESFAELIPKHPTIFRSQESQLRALLVKISSTTSSEDMTEAAFIFDEAHKSAAYRVFVLLHHCEPKQGSSERWDETLKAAIFSAHGVADQIFRSVIEDWQSTAGVVATPSYANADVQQPNCDTLGLSGWKGVYAGSERLISLLRLIQTFVGTATATPVNFRVGMLADLLTRLFSLAVPSSNEPTVVRPNNQISNEEREALWTVLPSLHVTALELASSLIDRFGHALMSVTQGLLDQAVWVFDSEKSDVGVRIASYAVLFRILENMGPSMSKETVLSLSAMVRACCTDLLPPEEHTTKNSNGTNDEINGISARGLANGSHSLLGSTKGNDSSSTNRPPLKEAASTLLPILLSKLPVRHVAPNLRAVMDKTAVLTQHREALLASVLNPPVRADGKAQASLLPLLARAYPGDWEVEALLRPRMPVIRTGMKRAAEDGYKDEDEIIDDDLDTEEDQRHDPAMDGEDHLIALESALKEQEATTGDQHQHASLAPEHDAEELYSLDAAPALRQDAPATLPTASKRTVDDPLESAPSPKRLRADLVAETLPPVAGLELPGPSGKVSAVQHTMAVEQCVVKDEPMQDIATIPTKPSVSVAPLLGSHLSKPDDDDLGSDFEMPPLTMEPSDDEYEDEEDE